MNRITGICVALAALLIVGCGGSSRAHVDPPYNYTPELYSFDILDSYDTDTSLSDAPLALNPYEYEGIFELYWSANSLENYDLYFIVSDRPDPFTGEVIYTETCGAGLWCDQGGALVCEYNDDFTMSCENQVEQDIGYLFEDGPPQYLYLILQICDIDSSYCEHASYLVDME